MEIEWVGSVSVIGCLRLHWLALLTLSYPRLDSVGFWHVESGHFCLGTHFCSQFWVDEYWFIIKLLLDWWQISSNSRGLYLWDVSQVDFLLGKAYSDWGHVSDAVAVYDQLISSHPNDFRGYLAKVIFFFCPVSFVHLLFKRFTFFSFQICFCIAKIVKITVYIWY